MRLETTLVVLDICVLMPLRLSDVLMDLRLEQLFSLHWTAEIEAEYLKNMQTAFGFTQAAVEGRLRAMRRRCPEWDVFVSAQALARVPDKVDAKDRHIAAAALDLRRFVEDESDKTTYDVFLVTDNVRHFAKAEMGKLGGQARRQGDKGRSFSRRSLRRASRTGAACRPARRQRPQAPALHPCGIACCTKAARRPAASERLGCSLGRRGRRFCSHR